MAGSTVEYASWKRLLFASTALCIPSRQSILRQPVYSKRMFEDHGLIRMLRQPDALLEAAHNCRSGAITIERSDGGETDCARERSSGFPRGTENRASASLVPGHIMQVWPIQKQTLLRWDSRGHWYCGNGRTSAGG